MKNKHNLLFSEITFISPRDVRKNRSDVVHIMRTCSGFVKNGMKVMLLTPRVQREGNIQSKKEVKSYYALDSTFFKLIESDYCIKENHLGETSFVKLVLLKLFLTFKHFLGNRNDYKSKNHIIISKCIISCVPIILLKKINLISSPLTLELIHAKKSFLYGFVVRHADFIISHSPFVTYYLSNFLKKAPHRIVQPPMITQSKEFKEHIKLQKEDYKELLGFCSNQRLVMYAGKVFVGSKEIQYIYEAAKQLPDIRFAIVGASPTAMRYYEEYFKGVRNITLYPFQSIHKYYEFVKSADILIAYYPRSNHYMYHLDPGKIGVYLASGNPVILSDLIGLRLRFKEWMVKFVPPDDVSQLVASIQTILSDYDRFSRDAERTRLYVESFDYEYYTACVLRDINKCIAQWD